MKALAPFFISAAVILAEPALAQDAAPTANQTAIGEQADWDICNETSYVLRLATAFIREGRMQAQGWDRVQPGACTTLTTTKGSPRFLYAESAQMHRGGIREWNGSTVLCAKEDDFQSDATDNCDLKNLGQRKYFAVKPTERQTALIEADDFGVNAETAGIQRLLMDVGYKVSRVDGLTGRRTSRSIRQFKTEKKLAADVSNQDLIAALAEAADSAAAEIGLSLCNQSTAQIWAAIAFRREGKWQSRGWWNIPVNGCAQPLDKSLKGTETHIFALQEDKAEDGSPLPDKRLRSGATTPAQFCVAEAKFAALGREYCTENGYTATNFRPVSNEEDNIVVNLADADFAALSASGLRR